MNIQNIVEVVGMSQSANKSILCWQTQNLCKGLLDVPILGAKIVLQITPIVMGIILKLIFRYTVWDVVGLYNVV